MSSLVLNGTTQTAGANSGYLPLFLTTSLAARHLCCDPRTLRRNLAPNGPIPCVRIGDTIRIPTRGFCDATGISLVDLAAALGCEPPKADTSTTCDDPGSGGGTQAGVVEMSTRKDTPHDPPA